MKTVISYFQHLDVAQNIHHSILIDGTIERFGYDPRRLKPCSTRLVVKRYDCCGSLTIKQFLKASIHHSCAACYKKAKALKAASKSLDYLKSRCTINATSNCWEWSGNVNENGYGVLCFGRRNQSYAHRYMWQVTKGEIPNDLCVLHRCDNPPCINPDHLFLGTRQDNNADKMTKGRHVNAFSKKGWGLKLRPAQVTVIKSLIRGDRQSLRSIGRQFGICVKTVASIRDGEYWRHVQ